MLKRNKEKFQELKYVYCSIMEAFHKTIQLEIKLMTLPNEIGIKYSSSVPPPYRFLT